MGPGAGPVRLKRLAAELRMRHRRLVAYRQGPWWPGKDHTWDFELRRYDSLLLAAALMLEVQVPEEGADGRFSDQGRAVLEDRLAVAGLDVMSAVDPDDNWVY
ncbi:MAG: hypothetical protein ACRD12_23845 [Acidimicrobiales bacterium]